MLNADSYKTSLGGRHKLAEGYQEDWLLVERRSASAVLITLWHVGRIHGVWVACFMVVNCDHSAYYG